MRWLLILLIAATNGWAMRADINGDHRVDFLDFSILASEWLETDMSNSYAVFNGTDGYISVPTDTALNLGTGDFTICFWIKTTTTTFGVYNGGTVRVYADGTKLYCQVISGLEDSWSYYISPSLIASDGWHFVLMVKTESGVKFYLDGNGDVTTTQGAKTGTPNGNSALSRIIGNFSGNYLSGSLDDLRIYKAALTSDEISNIYNGGRGCKYAESQTPTSGAASFVMDFDTINGDGNPTSLVPSETPLVGTKSGGVTIETGGVPFWDSATNIKTTKSTTIADIDGFLMPICCGRGTNTL